MRKVRILTFILCLMAIVTVSCFPVHAQAAHGVRLTWTQSTTPGITSNTVYQAPTGTGTYSKIFTSSTPITTYDVALTTANGGTSQCWEVTATLLIESFPSTFVCATFPVQTGTPSGLSATAF